MTQRKSKRGLGIKSARINNVALLGKLVHNMLNEKDKLWVQVLSQKYLCSELVLIEQRRLRTLYVWIGILKDRDVVAHGFGSKLGAGVSFYGIQTCLVQVSWHVMFRLYIYRTRR